MSGAVPPAGEGRIVVIGRGSNVWHRLRERPSLQWVNRLAIGHSEIGDTSFMATDVVWILAYSRRASENRAMFELLSASNIGRCIYVSTATANVVDITSCYNYPSVKARAECDARELLNAQVVRIGLVYHQPSELPPGNNAATSLDELSEAIAGTLGSHAPPRTNLFRSVTRPFPSLRDRALFEAYGRLIRRFRRRPCLLRPVDIILRAAGIRWYGYLYLSNWLWFGQSARSH